ncbi:MAG: PTS sugar transporter subunit IIA [Candidatus Omnitrophica bacterium]|nr:PTS sugar transporter subunit IIA [Candidatus Omnitrophota bacterium]
MAVASEIKLSSLLKEKYITLALEEKTKNKVIVEMVDLISQSGKVKDRRAFANAILKREKLGSTGIGNGVAIPHAKSPKVAGFVIGFGRHSAGIDFGALDGEKTHLFFILASPESDVGAHLKILADISRLVKDKFIVDRLKAAKDKKEILKLIANAEI